jgi:hypothetical protein
MSKIGISAFINEKRIADVMLLDKGEMILIDIHEPNQLMMDYGDFITIQPRDIENYPSVRII